MHQTCWPSYSFEDRLICEQFRELTHLVWTCCWEFVAVIPSGCCTGNFKYTGFIPDLTKAWLQSCWETGFLVEFFTEYFSLWLQQNLQFEPCGFHLPESSKQMQECMQSFSLLFSVSWHRYEDLGRSSEDDWTLKEHTYVRSKFLHWSNEQISYIKLLFRSSPRHEASYLSTINVWQICAQHPFRIT